MLENFKIVSEAKEKKAKRLKQQKEECKLLSY